MYKNTMTLGILLTATVLTACAGNNIKSEKSSLENQTTSENINSKQNSEVVLSDFPNDTSSEQMSQSSDDTANTSDNNAKNTQNTKQPQIKLVNFKFDQFELSDTSKTVIKQHAEFLVANPTYVISVNGHSDYRGPEIYNEKLSLRRANSVASLLMSYGAPESQIIINSFGASQPIEDYANWHQNRRVEFEYSESYMVSK